MHILHQIHSKGTPANHNHVSRVGRTLADSRLVVALPVTSFVSWIGHTFIQLLALTVLPNASFQFNGIHQIVKTDYLAEGQSQMEDTPPLLFPVTVANSWFAD